MGYNLKYKVEEEYKDLVNDIIKFVTILIVLNLLMFISNPTENVFRKYLFKINYIHNIRFNNILACNFKSNTI